VIAMMGNLAIAATMATAVIVVAWMIWSAKK
jgi:hypothetical protein